MRVVLLENCIQKKGQEALREEEGEITDKVRCESAFCQIDQKFVE